MSTEIVFFRHIITIVCSKFGAPRDMKYGNRKHHRRDKTKQQYTKQDQMHTHMCIINM